MPKTRNISRAFLCALAVCTLGLVCFVWTLPVQSAADEQKDYGYVYSGTKSNSVAFTTSVMRDDAMMVFGSSELSTPPRLIPEVPPVIFGTNNYGLNLTYVGEAYDQSLWQGIAAGAYARSLANKKIAIIVSPSWFTDGGLSNDLFKTRFSYSLYQAFCQNPDISDATKTYLCKRLLEQGVDGATVYSGLPSQPQDYLNRLVFSAADDLRLRLGLEQVRGKGFSHDEATASVPNFEAIRSQGVIDGAKGSTNNNWSIDDAYYAQNIEGRLAELAGTQDSETFTNTPEYDDFGFMLRACQEAGLEPLVIISPVNGYFYDHVGISSSTREACYDKMREITQAYGVPVADFSRKEYEQYFLHDLVHFGWTGWVDVESALYQFAKEG